MLTLLKKLWTEEEGQGLTEYGLILGLLAVGVVAILVTMGGSLTTIFQEISDKLGVGAGKVPQ
ncbi:MAG: pilus assembly protein Flp/PilA [Clostridia bacterium]|jgi:pilus assembly protein Flp/PilA|nr:Flp/Fap pilin component [Clostridiales bacterium]MDK2985676.1 pilus assembly protein Flp/PilA [Clostridia bacterium]